MQNAFIESFNGRLRDEFLNETLFTSLIQARLALEEWRRDDATTTPCGRIQASTGSRQPLTPHSSHRSGTRALRSAMARRFDPLLRLCMVAIVRL